MVLDILRHGIAEERRPGLADARRCLTEEGRDKLRRVLRRAARAGAAPSLILSSPLARAVQTAELAAEELGCKRPIVKTGALAPDADAKVMWNELARYAGEPEVLLAGHQPHIGAFTAHVLGAPRLNIEFKKGALVRVSVDLAETGRGTLEWMLTAGLAR